MGMRLVGRRGAQRKLRQLTRKLESTNEEMIAAMLARIVSRTMPYVPEDTSTILNSEQRKVYKYGGIAGGAVSYGEDGSINPKHGIPVSEYVDEVHNGPQKPWRKAGASNRFLSLGVRDFQRDDMSRIVAEYMGRVK